MDEADKETLETKLITEKEEEKEYSKTLKPLKW